jgi:hypothetical protein
MALKLEYSATPTVGPQKWGAELHESRLTNRSTCVLAPTGNHTDKLGVTSRETEHTDLMHAGF